eukprot:3637210-Prorocentrum_lima.AAC.1
MPSVHGDCSREGKRRGQRKTPGLLCLREEQTAKEKTPATEKNTQHEESGTSGEEKPGDAEKQGSC